MIKIAIIGAGPAGVFAAISAMENKIQDVSIDIYEKNSALNTILPTGNGRCNITNNTFDTKELASNYPRGEKFLYSVFNTFSVENTINWFKWHGLDLYTQDDNRVFPRTNDSNTVKNILLEIAKQKHINIKNNSKNIKIEYKNNLFIITDNLNSYEYDKLIIATGGNYKQPIDSGYTIAKQLGHSITPLKQALCGLVSAEKWPLNLAGVSIKNAEISVFYKNKKISQISDDFIFTHDGISGPCAFKVSSYSAFEEYNSQNPLKLMINFVPQYNNACIETELLNNLNKDSKKSIINILKEFIPKSLVIELLKLADINSEKKSSQITKEDRKKIIKLLTSTELNIKSTKPDGEIVTAGGIELKEINAKTMESKLVKNLYFCGEIVNVDGLTGGFNLQFCWSSGYIAGLNATD